MCTFLFKEFPIYLFIIGYVGFLLLSTGFLYLRLAWATLR